MKRLPAALLTILFAVVALSACVADSTSGVRVVGDNLAVLPAGDTMVLYKGGKSIRTVTITYDGYSTVKFACDDLFCDDKTATIDDSGKKVEVDSQMLFTDSYYVWRASNDAVYVQWPYGLDIQLPDDK